MALINDKQMQMRVSDDFLREVDDWRRAQPDIPSRTESIRRLVHTGLAARPILLDIQKTLVSLRPVGGESDLDAHIEAIRHALNQKSD